MRRMFSEKQVKEFVKTTKKDITTLVDANGNNRFIEGDIELKAISGVEKVYGKWSLSGTHLIIALAITIDDTTVIPSTKLADMDLPDWIKAKIYDNGSNVVPYTSFNASVKSGGSGTGNQNIPCSLNKTEADGVYINVSSITMNADRYCRIYFDLLID